MQSEKLGDIDLAWEGFYWQGNYNFPYDIEVHVCSEDEQPVSPHHLQQNAWDRFVKKFNASSPEILSAIFEFYNDIRPQYVQAGQQWIANMPVLSDPRDLSNMITLNYISISWPNDEDNVLIGMSYSCTWEQEHGLGVVIKDGVVQQVGGADCAIF